MHLAQHHFQAQNRYVEESARFAVSSVYFGAYGLVDLDLDAEAVANGSVVLRRACGILPDGLAFDIPDDPAPQPLSLTDRFPADADSQVVVLAIPRLRPAEANCALDQATVDGCRFVASSREVRDETTGQDVKSVQMAQKNFRLLVADEVSDGLVTLSLTRVRRDGAGGFEFDRRYVPPCLQLRASRRLQDDLRRLVEALEQKAESLGVERGASARGLADYASREVANFWLSHTIHSALGSLRHYVRTGAHHPEHVYVDLARLAGALCTFSLDSDPTQVPAYDHDDLGGSFDALDRHIRSHLDEVVPTNRITVPLSAADPLTLDEQNAAGLTAAAFHVGAVPDERCYGDAMWVLGVRARMSSTDLVASVPRLVKLCSSEDIVKLVKRALPGASLEHLKAPPAAISPGLGVEYFRIDRSGPAWEVVSKRRSVGVYVPEAIEDAELELSVVLET